MFRLGLAAEGHAHVAFLARARMRARPGKAVSFSGGRNLVDTLKTYTASKGAIDRVDIFSHGWDCGVIGATSGDVGFYVDDPGCHLSGMVAASVSDFAKEVKNGKIKIPRNGEISFWGCNTFRVAEALFTALKDQGTPVDTVIGANGGTAPIHNERGMETGIFAAKFFQSIRTGVRKKRRMWNDPKF